MSNRINKKTSGVSVQSCGVIWMIPIVSLYLIFIIPFIYMKHPMIAMGCFPAPLLLTYIYWRMRIECGRICSTGYVLPEKENVLEKGTVLDGGERELDNTRMMLEALIEQLPVPVVVASSLDYIVRYGNRAAMELLGVDDEPTYIGLSMEEVQKRQSWREYLMDGTPISLDQLPLIQALHGESKQIDEYRIVRKDGSIRLSQVSGTPIYNHNGELIAGLIVFPDITDRKKAEETVRESDFIFRSQFNHGNIGLAITSPGKNWLRVNKRLCEMLGYSEEELLTKTWVEMTHPDDIEADVAQFNRLVAGEIDSYEMDKRFFHKDGRIIDTHLTVSCFRNEDRSVKFVIASLFDFTSKKRHAMQIVQEKLFTETLINTLPGIFYLFDEETNVVRWNRNLELVSGFTKEEICSRKVLDWFSSPEMKERIGAAIEHVWREGYGTVEGLLAMKDGRQVHYLLSSNSIEIDGRKYLMGIGIDLEERYRAEEALRESENRLRSLIEASPMGIHLYELDREENLLFMGANPASERILDLDYRPLIGKTIEESFPPLKDTEVPHRYRLAASEGIPWHAEQIDYKDNQIRGAYEIYAFQTSPGRMASFFGDISERKRFELEQKRYTEEIERFNQLFVGREQRIIELKQRVNELSVELKRKPDFDLTQIEEITKPLIFGLTEESADFPNDITSPDWELTDLVDLKEIQPLLDYFSQSFGIASAIVSLDGRILIESSWQPICTQFHRIHPQTRERCMESDIVLSRSLHEGERFSIYRCRNGLTDCGSPISINGRHVANAFVGQFFMESPERAVFQRQADEFGFDSSLYLEAMRQVPIIPEEKLPMILGFLSTLSELLAQIGVDRIKQKRVETILEQRANELDARNRELKQQRAAAISLAEDAEKSRLEAEQIQMALKESNRRYDELVERIPVGVYQYRMLAAGGGFFDYVSPRFCRIHHFAGDELPRNPQSAFDAIFPDDYLRLLEANKTARQLLQVFVWEGRLLVDNEVRWIHLESFPTLLDSGDIVWDGILQDVTARKKYDDEKERLENQLRQAQKMEAVGQLAGGVAHDFNNLLQVINGYTEMAIHAINEEKQAYNYLKNVEKAGERAAGLVSQLLAFSRRQLMKPENLDLNDVLASLLKMMGRVIGEHIRLDFVPGHPLGMVCADRNMIEQVIMNLCVNARDAMPNGGTLTIETKDVRIDSDSCDEHTDVKPGDYVLVGVTDSGCGMDEATRAKIFEPFFTTKKAGQGTGLGLSTVYGIVKQHDGMISVYSEINKGTRFAVYLPRCETVSAPVSVNEEKPVAGGTETILVAEDDAMVRSFVQQLLESAGYTVILAADGEDALRLYHLHAKDIQLLLLDVVMPRMGGREVYDSVRKQSPSIRILFTSGYSENAVHTNFVLEEGLDLIQKPYNRNHFLQTIRQTLDKPSKEKEPR